MALSAQSWQPGPALPPLADATLPPQTSVAILGGGLVAYALAWFLRQHDVSCAVLSPHPTCLDESVRGLGLIMPGIAEPPAALAHALGESSARALYDFSRQGVQTCIQLAHAVKASVFPTPALMGARQPSDLAGLHASAALLKRWYPTDPGACDWSVLEGTALASRTPAPLLAAICWPDGALIRPLELCYRLAGSAAEQGARVVPGLVLERVEECPDGLRVHTSAGVVAADVVIHAGGVACAHLSPLLATSLLTARVQFSSTAQELEPTQAFPVVLAPERAAHFMPGTSGQGFDYWRPEVWAEAKEAGALHWTVGGSRYLTLELGMEAHKPPRYAQIDERHQAFLKALLQTEVLGPLRQWTRLLDVPCDNLPLVGTLPGQPRQLVLTGLNGLDSTIGLEAARCLVDNLLEMPDAQPVPSWFQPRRLVGA